MKPIETPTFSITPRCIWNSFRSSTKLHLALTGCSAADREALLPRLQEYINASGHPCILVQEGDECRNAFRVNLASPFGSIGCVIMASGLGRRFGGNKLLASFLNAPLICRALAATEGVFARRVVVTRHREIAELCREYGIDAVLHDLPSRSDAVRLGLEALGDVQACLFCPGDQPLLTRDTVAALALAAANDPSFIWRAACDDVPGSPVLFPAWAFDELCALPAGRGGGYVAERHAGKLRTLAVEDPFELMDVDYPEDLKLLEDHFRNGEVLP